LLVLFCYLSDMMGMRKFIAAGFLFVGLADGQHADGKTQVNDIHHIQRLNSADGMSWKAGHNEFFNGMAFDDARVVLGTALNPEQVHPFLQDDAHATIQDSSIPTDFDARSQWPGLIHPIRNQMRCGSCWAFSASEVLSDRFAIASKAKSPVLSVEDMVSCDKGDLGCHGGQLPKAWDYLTNTGIVTDSCFPYAAGDGTAPVCPSRCQDSEPFYRFKARNAYAIKGVTNMQKDIMANGPIQVAFKVYKSFMSYKSGVYKKHIWEILPEGGHAVKIVGWGVEAGQDYWLVANSWGTTWGLEGYFKMARGSDACGMESMGPPYAGVPQMEPDSVLVL
jgi:cathepsin B